MAAIGEEESDGEAGAFFGYSSISGVIAAACICLDTAADASGRGSAGY